MYVGARGLGHCVPDAALAALPAFPILFSLQAPKSCYTLGTYQGHLTSLCQHLAPSTACTAAPRIASRLRAPLVPVARPCPGMARCKRGAEGCGGRKPCLLK